MSPFQLWGLIGAGLWLGATALWFRRSTPVLIGGLVAIALYAAAAMALGWINPGDLGLRRASVLETVGYALAWLGVMLLASPVADRFASALFKKPPTLGAFKALQQSRARLITGIALAWLLGGVLEELALRGLIYNAVEWGLDPLGDGATIIAILVTSLAAWVLHLYQGLRAALIVALLSALFSILYTVAHYSLWAVMLCHGLYDTVAFVRFATGRSKYSRPPPD